MLCTQQPAGVQTAAALAPGIDYCGAIGRSEIADLAAKSRLGRTCHSSSDTLGAAGPDTLHLAGRFASTLLVAGAPVPRSKVAALSPLLHLVHCIPSRLRGEPAVRDMTAGSGGFDLSAFSLIAIAKMPCEGGPPRLSRTSMYDMRA
jgi:hypothetical protein